VCTVGDDDEWVCGLFEIGGEGMGWEEGSEWGGLFKGLGKGERGLTGGIRLLPARANQRLLGMGWLGMGRVKGVCWPGG